MRFLVTGGAGFIGSNFIRLLLREHSDVQVTNLDVLTYAGNLDNLRDIEDDPRYQFLRGDIGDPVAAEVAMAGVDMVVHFAAESHNDRAVQDPWIFLRTNVLGTQTLLEAARRAGVKRFHHISTCEVFGDLALDESRAFRETDPYCPRTPYNASKAAANHAVMSYFHTFGLPVSISHCANNYGPYQFPEKLIPLFVTQALENLSLPLFKSSHHRREWIHVEDHCRAVLRILEQGRPGQAYNIGSGVEKSVEEITDVILDTLGKPSSLKQYVPDRLGHDRRYLLDTGKLQKEMAWCPLIPFEEGVVKTIQWYVEHEQWWRRVKSGAYRAIDKAISAA
ncbi:dTDP-glucose 4,6-dehydratase [Candidatus Uhrbacteria bacterium]|nr:dTDP-glucose 4,6-dehydratase [Candidatus Uhrbacteria bacterium]